MNKDNIQQYDAIIIGTGQAGKPLAKKLSDEGWKIAVVEEAGEGGSCINYGCTPTKTMISSAQVAYILKNSLSWGINHSGMAVDFDVVIGRRDEIVNESRIKIRHMLEDSENIDYIKGLATFRNKYDLEISRQEEHEPRKIIRSDKIFINTGSLPDIPSIKGLDTARYYTAKTWMGIKKLPENLLILGGGYIGIEFAQMFHRLGSKVTVFQMTDQLLPREDRDVAIEMLQILWDEGIRVHLNTKVEELKTMENGSLEISFYEGQMKRSMIASHFLVATGTKAATADLHPEKAGLKMDEKGYIQVNDILESSVKGIYALGDCKGGPEFTHISYDDFRIITDHLFGDKHRRVSDRPVPYTLFTDPQLGRIGWNENQCLEKKIKFRKAVLESDSIARARETGHTRGFIKVLVGEDDYILGASVLMDEGGEIASLIQTAMMGRLKYQVLRDAVFAHPTYAESLNNLFSKINH